MKIPFTQFLLPDGRQRKEIVECPEGLEDKTQELLDAKASFECEMLQTGDVSFTIEFELPNGENQTLAHEINPNDPSVPDAIEKLINRGYEQYKDIELSEYRV